ncbi:MAG: methionine synthase [Armatimonadota bacterium]|jgi:methionine synthase II (cobalamin-independent)
MEQECKNGFRFTPTVIGSMPYVDAAEAVAMVLSELPDAPAWPQLPRRSPLEQMYVQYSEGMPCVDVDEEEGQIQFRQDDEYVEELAGFYESYLAGEWDAFAISPEYAPGLWEMLRRLDEPDNGDCLYVKGQVTGPVSFALSVTDDDDQAVMHDPQLADVATKALAAKARWQVRELKETGREVILFFDEPYLAAFGSGFVSLSREQVVAMLEEVIAAAADEGAIVGVHCCANTDWSLLMATSADIINFDAYGYMEGMTLYPRQLTEFLERGGILAWGVVPSSDEVLGDDAEAAADRFVDGIDQLARRGVPRELLLRSALITPSCGAGTLSPDAATAMVTATRETGAELRDRFG